jgi:anaerobic magnesium-protoporphyrin IX monomethyl ester cyclase
MLTLRSSDSAPTGPPALKEPVCLVIPPSVFLLDERVFMSLGILKVAACLERAGHAVEVLDLSGIENFVDVAELHARSTRAGFVCLTATTPQLPAATQIAERVRSVRHDVKLVLGGPHVTLVHSAVKLEAKQGRIGRAHEAFASLQSIFDVLVSGDGEMAIFRALERDAPRLVDADDPKGGLFMTNRDYEETPYPARKFVDVGSYRYSIEGHAATSLIAQLGCPFGCGFCGGRNSKSLRMIRTRSWQSIVAELDLLHTAYGFTGYMFYDDELNVNPKMIDLMNGIAALQERKGVEFRLRGFIKAELFTDAQAAAMYRAGFRWLLCGFEAASPRMLENINKQATLEDNTRVLEIARRHDLKVKALMSIGHPGESEESVRAVHDWLIDVRPDDFDCTIITTYPGTPYYDEALPHASQANVWTYTCKNGDRLHAYDVDFSRIAEYYKGDPDGGYRAYVFTDHLSSESLVTLRDWVERGVRERLGIPFNASAASIRYEHSMGQGPIGLPDFILRSSEAVETPPTITPPRSGISA